MCRWCWGFEPVRRALFDSLPSSINTQRLVGGLAPDSDEPMPSQMQEFLKGTWSKIQQTIPGTEFNFDFWDKCQPRRSTYPSNRAVIAARLQHPKFDLAMTLQIQQAYYQQAKNPSDIDVLIELADGIGLDVEQFKSDLSSQNLNDLLNKEISFTRQLGLNSFPSMAVVNGDKLSPIRLDYLNAGAMADEILEKSESVG